MKNHYLYFLTILILTSCAYKQTNVKQIPFEFSNLSPYKISNYVENYTIIPLETRDDNYFTSSKKIKIKDGIIYILDTYLGKRDQILIFDSLGIFKSKIHYQGRGPKEYINISDFDVNPNEDIISILDPGANKLINYNSNSEYQDEQKINFYAKEFKYLTKGNKTLKVFVSLMSKLTTGISYDVNVYDENNNFIYSSLPFEQTVGIVLGNGINLMNVDNSISYLKPNSNIIYKIGDNSTETKFKLIFSFKLVPGDEISNIFYKGKKSLGKYVYNIHYFETQKMIVAQFMHKQKIYSGIYDKVLNESLLFEDQKDPSCECNVSLNIKGVYKNSFIVESDYLKITRLLKILDPENIKCLTPEVLGTKESWNITSNPILLLVNFKM